MLIKTARRILERLSPQYVGRLRAWRTRREIDTYRARTVSREYGGLSLTVRLTDPLSEGWYDSDWPPLPELELLRSFNLKPGARVFDLGAHQGIVAMMLADAVGKTGQVIAVEACHHNFLVAEKNRLTNGMTQLAFIHAAASDKPGRVIFNANLNGQLDDGTGSSGSGEVDAITIDGLAEQFGLPDVVYLDIEGAEWLALQGAKTVLQSGADFFVEVHASTGLEKLGGSIAKIFSCFPAEQFDLYVREDEAPDYRAYSRAEPLLTNRFHLVAHARK